MSRKIAFFDVFLLLNPTLEPKYLCLLLLAVEKYTCVFCVSVIHLFLWLLWLEVGLFEQCCCVVDYKSGYFRGRLF